MKFLRYFNSEDWWKWPIDEGLTVYNINGGHHEIDENSERFMYGTVIEADSWADLCQKVGYNPWRTDSPTPEMWIAPNGEMFDCGFTEGHEGVAHAIWTRYLGHPVDDILDMCGDLLIENDWIKVTRNSIMYEHYRQMGMYDYITQEQYESLKKWRIKYAYRF